MVSLRAQVSDVDGREWFEDAGEAPRSAAAALGADLARRLLERGAGRVLGR